MHQIGLYKVAIGDDISKAEAPGLFDIKVRYWILPSFPFLIPITYSSLSIPVPKPSKTNIPSPQQGKAKKKAWQEKVDSGITADQAKEKYVAKIEELKEKCGYDPNKAPEAVGGN